MRTLHILQHISLDAIIQSPGAPTEDPTPDFPHGGWSPPFADPAVGEVVAAAHAKPFDLLLGRRTYDIWAGYWPNVRTGAIAESFNKVTKYVATHRPENLAWGPAKPLGPDIVEGIRRLKAADGPDLILWGSSTLTSILLEHTLADEITLFTYPVFLGAGKRFFSDTTAPRELKLISSKTVPSGVQINTYRPNGPLRTGCYLKPPS